MYFTPTNFKTWLRAWTCHGATFTQRSENDQIQSIARKDCAM